MPINRKTMTKEDEALFQRATEAIRLFAEGGDEAKDFLNALKREDGSGARASLNAALDRLRKQADTATDPGGVPAGKGKSDRSAVANLRSRNIGTKPRVSR
jgi:hypothetical protein